MGEGRGGMELALLASIEGVLLYVCWLELFPEFSLWLESVVVVVFPLRVPLVWGAWVVLVVIEVMPNSSNSAEVPM